MTRFWGILSLALVLMIGGKLTARDPIPQLVRIKNDAKIQVERLRIGKTAFYEIEPEELTLYQIIPNGQFLVQGAYKGYGHTSIIEYIEFVDQPLTRWTLTVTSHGHLHKSNDTYAENADPSYVRFRNDFLSHVDQITIGPVSFYDIPPGEVTEYQRIGVGDFAIYGTVKGYGKTSIHGKTTIRSDEESRYWTQRMTVFGELELLLDDEPI